MWKGMNALELHAVTDGSKSVEQLADIILSISASVDYVHIREKEKKAGEIIRLIELLIKSGFPNQKLVINDRLDVALVTGIRNVHLPGCGIPVQKVKGAFPDIRTGVSVHSLEEAVTAEKDGADYIMFGHIFQTNCKKGKAPKGVDVLRKITECVKIPVIAIGGIEPGNIKQVLEQRAAGAAVMSYIFSSSDPENAAKLLRRGEKASEGF